MKDSIYNGQLCTEDSYFSAHDITELFVMVHVHRDMKLTTVILKSSCFSSDGRINHLIIDMNLYSMNITDFFKQVASVNPKILQNFIGVKFKIHILYNCFQE